ncbi:MAG: 1-phosphofructokinase family hexose kinase [Clostridia bacterium]|nr:1-phosphofructokinase family hexose kinase [Clostridia bacterium]
MILSICPNPSKDCTLELDCLNVGRLNRIRSKTENYSGKGLNVAIGVARLGGDSFATGFMFDDGQKQFEDRLQTEKVKFKFVGNGGSVRVNYKIIDSKSMLTEINDKGDEVSLDKQEELISLIGELAPKSDIVVISGSLPQGVAPSFYYEAIKNIPDGVKIIVDSGKENMEEALRRNIYLVKPNKDELEEIVGVKLNTKAEILSACKLLIGRGAENVLVSLGEDGAILTNGKDSYYCRSESVAVNSTVGAGDSMVAAVCMATEKNETMEEILRCAVAAGTAAIMTSGTNLFYKDRYDEIYKRLSVKKL